jgi:hypothetical protein
MDMVFVAVVATDGEICAERSGCEWQWGRTSEDLRVVDTK